MAACNFNIPFSGSAENVMNKAKKAVEGQNGTFTGDVNRGNFEVSIFGNSIAGSYIVSGSNLEVIIESKPLLVPCSAIEGFLKSQLS